MAIAAAKAAAAATENAQASRSSTMLLVDTAWLPLLPMPANQCREQCLAAGCLGGRRTTRTPIPPMNPNSPATLAAAACQR